jgi:hypothetical protein
MIEISIIVCSNRKTSLIEFISCAHALCHHPERVELIIAIDRDDEEMVSLYESGDLDNLFNFKTNFLLFDNPEGYYGTGPIYNCCVLAASPSSYFVQLCSDRLRFEYQHWDDKYLDCKHYFEDDIFIIRTSSLRCKKYDKEDRYELLISPDNFRVYTKKMYGLLEGIGDYWSSDTWHEPTLHLLGEEYGHYRQLVCDVNIFSHDTSYPCNEKSYDEGIKIETKIKAFTQDKYYVHTFHRVAQKIAREIESLEPTRPLSTLGWLKEH